MRPLCITLLLTLGLAPGGVALDDTKSANPAENGKVVREQVVGDILHPKEKVLRITGKVKVIDANTVGFEDGTQVTVTTTMDAPDLGQKGLMGDKFYPAGKEAAEFLRKLTGDKPVTFYAWGNGEGREAKLRGRCFVGETQLGVEMVRNGWAISHHSAMVPYEIIARENKRGLWRGEFVLPELWRKGERLKGEE
jgi:endonuclease YncB( thermonuclease family)